MNRRQATNTPGAYPATACWVIRWLGVVFALTGLTFAADTKSLPAEGSAVGERHAENLRRWQALDAQQRQVMRERYEQYANMPPEEQARLRELYKQYERLDPRGKAVMRENWELLSKLNADELARIRQLHKRVKTMPPERRRRLVRLYKHLRKRTLEQQTDLLHRVRRAPDTKARLAAIHAWLDETHPSTRKRPQPSRRTPRSPTTATRPKSTTRATTSVPRSTLPRGTDAAAPE